MLSDASSSGTWSSSNTSVATVLAGSVTGAAGGSTTISYSYSTGCAATTTFVVNPTPVAYTVTGGGSYCVGTSGVHIGLSFGNTGTNYQLYNGSTLVSSIGGSNSGVDFGCLTSILFQEVEVFAVVALGPALR
jgi:hypothetical protein